MVDLTGHWFHELNKTTIIACGSFNTLILITEISNEPEHDKLLNGREIDVWNFENRGASSTYVHRSQVDAKQNKQNKCMACNE